MNLKAVSRTTGYVLIIEGLLMLPAVLVSLIYRETSGLWILLVAVGALIAGHILKYLGKNAERSFVREGFAIAGLTWVVMSMVGALPFTLSGAIPSYVDAVFETISGFTTTGSSILTDVEALDHGMLFWRSFTHWIGGMGILVFMLAVRPQGSTKADDMLLMKAESPGPVVEKMVPRLRETAGILYKIYMALTAAEIVLLLVTGMHPFDAFCISFGTAGTGGFGVLNASIASYSTPQHIIIGIFMLLFGVNFNLYYLLLIRHFTGVFHSEELRAYLSVVVVSTLMITANVWYYCSELYSSLAECLKVSFVQVGSIMTTTGFCITDFEYWPAFSKTILVLLMFCGASAGSTGGGLKVSRLLIGCKLVKVELQKLMHPRSVRTIRMDGKEVSTEVAGRTAAYFIIYVLIFVVSLVLVSIDNFDLITNFTAVAATINNIGPGLGVCGATGNYSSFSVLSKIVMMFDMLVGRLEIFPMLFLFSPAVWKRKRDVRKDRRSV